MNAEVFLDKYEGVIGEIRGRLKVVLVVFASAVVAGFFLFQKLLGLFFLMFSFENVDIVVSSPFQVFGLAVNVGMFLGVVVAFPVLLVNLIRFVSPGLSEEERGMILPFVLISLVLFLIGSGFGLGVMKVVLSQVARLPGQIGMTNYWDVGKLLSQVFLMVVILGVVFQFPIVFYLLVRFNLIDLDQVREKHRLIIFVMVVFAALLPTTDALSLVVIAGCLVGLFELTLLFINHKTKGGMLCLAE